jgi:hypothetical protein
VHDGTCSPETCLSTVFKASVPNVRSGWRRVVNAGRAKAATMQSSKPQMATSSGTFSPCSFSTSMAPSAM